MRPFLWHCGKMLPWSFHFLLMLIWITNSERLTPVMGNRKLNLQFDDVAFMDSISREGMRRMHDDLDTDEDGNVSETEGKVALKTQEIGESSEKNANLAGFATDVDGRISEEEFWESWIHSDVHNWTNAEILTWLKYDVELPQYTSIFHALNISGSAFPVLASNGSLVTALVEGSKENKLKLMLKAREIVLFGPSKEKANFLKDALLTISLLLALSGIFFGVHVQRNANRTIEGIQEKMKALQKSMESIAEVESEMEKIWAHDVSTPDDDRSRGSNSGESEDSISLSDDVMMSTRLAEVLKELDFTKEALRKAEKQIERRACGLPAGLLDLLQTTYQVESNFFETQKEKVTRDVEQTKAQFKKIERIRSTFFGVLQVVHSRQMDSFDFHVQQTKDEFRELQGIMRERRKRWEKIQQLCKFRIRQSSSSKSGTPSRLKSSPEEDVKTDSGIINSCSSVGVIGGDRSVSYSQRSNGRRSKRPSLITLLDDEGFDVTSLQSFSQRACRSPSERHVTLPTHVSSPSLSSYSNGHHERVRTPLEAARPTIPHSESVALLPSHLQLPETGNQTFPKRSPVNKRRAQLPDSMVKREVAVTPEEPRSASETNRCEAKSAVSGDAVRSAGFNDAKRSSSMQSLPGVRKGSELKAPVTLEAKILNGAIPGSFHDKAPLREEKERKSNVLKRMLRLGKDKKR